MSYYTRDNVLRHFKALAREVGDKLKLSYGRATGISTKEDGTTQCDQDILASKMILEHFNTFFSKAGVLEEETLRDDRAEGRQCLGADGLDYTRGYIRGDSADYGVLLFLLDGFRPVVALSYKPERNEMIWAVEGEGAYLNDDHNKIKVADLDEIRLVTSRSRGGEPLERMVKELSPTTRRQIGGSTKYLEIAKGEQRVDEQGKRDILTVGYQPQGVVLNPWDLAVLPVIVGEAGGMVRTASGNPISLARRDSFRHEDGLIIANNQRNYEAVLEAARRCNSSRE